MTCHRVIGDECIWEIISLMNALMLAGSVNQWSIKRIKVFLLQVKGLIKVIVKFRAENILCTYVSCTKHFWGAQNNVHEDDFVAIILWKGINWKFFISLKGNKLSCFAN